MNNKGNSFPGIPTKFFPIIADIPIPKIVNASPVATWFVRSDCVSTPKIIEIIRPESIEPITAKNKLSVITINANPEIAPMIIIPSTPRFKTPDLSVINSPDAASINGTDDAIIAPINIPMKFKSKLIFF